MKEFAVVKPSKPVDLYVRVSRVGGRENLISPEEQQRRARELAREKGLRLGYVLTDLDESGGKLDRPGLQEALRRVESGKSGGIIVAWLDRLSRDSEHAHALVRRISEAGGVIYAPDAPSDWTSPEGELQAGIVFAFATYVRKRARAGFERAKERSIQNGVPVNRFAPIGYRKNAERKLEPDPLAAPLIREAFQMRAAGAGPKEIALFLEQKGISPSYGRPEGSGTGTHWYKESLYQLFRNRTYLGEISYGGRFVNPNAHEPIVDSLTWTAAQKPRVSKSPNRGSEFLLTGIVRCGNCRYALQGTTIRGKRSYRCKKVHAGGICPQPVHVAAEKLEEIADDFFRAVTYGDSLNGKLEQDEAEIQALAEELGRAERRLEQARSEKAQDAWGEEWTAIVTQRRADRDVKKEALAHALAGSKRVEVPLESAYDSASIPEKREILSRIFPVVIYRDEIIFWPEIPDDLPRRGITPAALRAFGKAPQGAQRVRISAPPGPRRSRTG